MMRDLFFVAASLLRLVHGAGSNSSGNAASLSRFYENKLGGRCGKSASGRVGENSEEQLYFMKTTKTGGTSLRELFLRFAVLGEKRVLRSSLPGGILFGPNGASNRWLSQKSLWPPNDKGYYDIAFDHSTLDPVALSRYMPNATMITVSRDPLQRIRSAVAFFHDEATPEGYVLSTCKDPTHHRVWNSVAWQFKVPSADAKFDLCASAAVYRRRFENADVSAATRRISAGNIFVMLTERMDESRVLLRSLLCWRWLDVLIPAPPLQENQQAKVNRKSFQQQQQQQQKTTKKRLAAPKPPAPPPLRQERLLAMNALDVKIHDAAKDKFEELAKTYGETRLSNDVTFLRRYQSALSVMCLSCCGSDALPSTNKDLRDTLPGFSQLSCEDVACVCDALMCPVRAVHPPQSSDRTSVNSNIQWKTGCTCSKRTLRDCNEGQDALERAMLNHLASCNETMRQASICSSSSHNEKNRRESGICARGEICFHGYEGNDARVLDTRGLRITADPLVPRY